MTDPEENLEIFVRHVQIAREKFEANLPEPVLTEPVKAVRKAFRFAIEERALVEVLGLTRMGKTKGGAEPMYLRYLDRCVWLDCPTDEADRTFLFALAAAVGISGGTGKKVGQIRPQIAAVFATGMIDLVIVDEAHFLWPADKLTKPKRIEYLRAEIHRDGAVGVLVIATPQFAASMQAVMAANPRWAPGQWDGRVIRYHLRDTMTAADLGAVARHHAPDFTAEMIDGLVAQALACEGFCGLMVNTIKRARREALEEGLPQVTPAILITAQVEMARGTRIEQLAKVHAAQQTKPAPPPRRRDLAPATVLNGNAVRF